MFETLTTIIAFIVVLGILIFVHELGHYLAARHVGVRVETFSIGFPPKMWGKKIGDTDYIVSWLPIGGYVKLFGQNMDDEDPDDPTNYASKSILQRFYILVAGPVMNLVFALVFMPLVFIAGIDTPKYLQESPTIYQVQEEGFAKKIGLQPGDQVLSVNGVSVKTWEEALTQINQIESSNLSIEILRDNKVQNHSGTLEELKTLGLGWIYKIAPVIGGFSENSPIQQAGLQVGDRLVRLNDIPIENWHEISGAIQAIQGPPPMIEEGNAPDPSTLAGTPMMVTAERNGMVETVEVTPYYNTMTQSFLLGMNVENLKRSYGVVESVEMGTERLLYMGSMTFYFLGKLLSGNGSMDELGGPLKIGIVIGEAARTGIANLFFLMAFISLQLGIFNLLPIPALDGGHIFFLIVEKIKGGPLSQAIREKTQMVGFAILMVFMIAVTYNDILQL